MPVPAREAPAVDDDRLLTLAELAALLALGATATKQLVRRSDFPPAVRLSRRTVRWWRAEVIAWLDTQRSVYRPAASPGTRTADVGCPSIRRGRPRVHL